MDVPWEGSFKCDYDDDLFECYVPTDMPRHVHELHKDYGNLNDIDFATVGSNNLHAFEKNSTDENAEVESDDEEETNVQIPMDVHSTKNASDLPFDFFRSKLVEHFDMLFQSKKISWPKMGIVQKSS